MNAYHNDLFTKHLSDETAYDLWFFLQELSLIVEQRYLTQIKRYDSKLKDLDFNDDIPF